MELYIILDNNFLAQTKFLEQCFLQIVIIWYYLLTQKRFQYCELAQLCTFMAVIKCIIIIIVGLTKVIKILNFIITFVVCEKIMKTNCLNILLAINNIF